MIRSRSANRARASISLINNVDIPSFLVFDIVDQGGETEAVIRLAA
jgi:hypothetical protein